MPSGINYLIIHGAYGSPNENWFRWLESHLRKSGAVYVPVLPTPDGQNLAAWRAVTEKILENCEPHKTILIGHSSGANFVLRLAETALRPYKAVFSICPFMHNLNLPEFDVLNDSFVHPVPEWERVKSGAEKIVCFAGDNDPYVALALSQEVAEKCGAEMIIVPQGGHLNAAAGYKEFPLLLQIIRRSS